MNATDDPLLNTLVQLGHHFSRPVNPTGAVSGLPLNDGRLTPELFVRAAARSGFEARIVKRSINELHTATYPIVLLMESGQVAILESREDDILHLSVPGAAASKYSLTSKEVKQHYTGYAIQVRTVPQSEARSDFKQATKKPRHWFWSTLWRFRHVYMHVAMASLVINVLGLSSSLFVMNVYDRVVPNQAVETLYVLGVGVLAAYSFEFLLKTLRTIFVDRAGQRADIVMGADIFEKILAGKFGNRPASAGSLAGQARAYENLREFFASATVSALTDLPFVLLFIGVVYLIGGPVAVPLLAGAIVALGLALLMQIPMSRSVEKGYQSSNQRYALLVESINAMETVKATCSESQFQSRMEDSIHQSARADGKSRWYSQLTMNLIGFTQHIVSTAIVVVAFYQVMNENLSMGGMIACVMLSGRAMAPLNVVASLLVRLQQSRRSLKGITDIMETPTEREDGAGRITVPNFEPKISVQDVHFGHGDDGSSVFKGLSFDVQVGERVALMGRIGSGKSTLLRLITALYEPRAGNVTVSGIENRQLDPTELRQNIGYVPQEPTLLYGTLRTNLTAGISMVDDEQLWKAIEYAGLADFVRSQQAGLDLPVSEGGRSLSGGQRQAVMLARALVHQPRVLLLDEPTSAMDLQAERHVVENLGRWLTDHPMTSMVVATHKRSVLSIVDRVIAIDRGVIVTDGAKDTVIRNRKKAPAGEQPRTQQPEQPSADAVRTETPAASPNAEEPQTALAS